MVRSAQSGFNLLELIIVTAIGSIIGLGVAQLLSWTTQLQIKASELQALEVFKQDIVRNLSSEAAWANTLAANSGGSMACLWNFTPCTVGGGAASAPLTNQPIVLSDSGTAPGRVIFDARNPANGLTAKGTPCVGFAAAPAQGNDACPFRYDLTWSAVCTAGNCVAPQVSVSAILRYNPRSTRRLVVDTDRLSINQYYLPPAVACQAKTQVYGTPGNYNFIVPSAFSVLVVEAWGGGGGASAVLTFSGGCNTAPGGNGGASSFGGLVAAGGQGATSPSSQTLNTWIFCAAGFCGVLQWPHCPGTAPVIQGGNGYPESGAAIPASVSMCSGSAGAGGGQGGQNYSYSGSAGGGGGAGNYHNGSFLVGGGNWFVFDQWYATGGGGVDPASPGPTQAASLLPAPALAPGQRPWLSGRYARAVYSPGTLAPGSAVPVTVGAGGIGGTFGGGISGGNGAGGLVKITWR